VTWAPGYITVQEASDFVRTSTSGDEALLAVWITAASRAIDARCNRQFGKVDAPASFTYDEAPVYDPATGLWFLAIDDVQDTTGLTVGGVALASSGAALWPRNAAAKGKPYTHLVWTSTPTWTGPLDVFAPFGWTEFPAQVVAATGLQVSRFAARRDSPYGVTGSTNEGGQLRLLARLDPDVSVSLAGLSRPRKAR
jgi:hypothetical protein